MQETARSSLRLKGDLDSPGTKRDYNRRLFTVVAPRYDFVNRLLSFGCDRRWKRALVRLLPDAAAPVCVDAACGTGDLAEQLRKRFPLADITGVDLTEAMLVRAGERLAGANVKLVLGDMCRLDAGDGSVDILTGGYALRNAPDLGAFLAEARRVLKPGGVAAFLDLRRPDNRWLASAQTFLLRVWGGFWGFVFHRDPHAYLYLAESLSRYPRATELRALFERTGFRIEQVRHPLFGLAEILVVRKPASAGS